MVLAGKELRFLTRAGVAVHLSLTLDRANADHLQRIIEFAKEMGMVDIGVGAMRLAPQAGASCQAQMSKQIEAIVSARRRGKALGIPVLG